MVDILADMDAGMVLVPNSLALCCQPLVNTGGDSTLQQLFLSGVELGVPPFVSPA